VQLPGRFQTTPDRVAATDPIRNLMGPPGTRDRTAGRLVAIGCDVLDGPAEASQQGLSHP